MLLIIATDRNEAVTLRRAAVDLQAARKVAFEAAATEANWGVLTIGLMGLGEVGGVVRRGDGMAVEIKPLRREQAELDVGVRWMAGWADDDLVMAWNASGYAIPRDVPQHATRTQAA